MWMVKYGPEILHQAITMTLNKCFEEHIDINVGKGILAPINKPNKTKGPKRTFACSNFATNYQKGAIRHCFGTDQ